MSKDVRTKKRLQRKRRVARAAYSTLAAIPDRFIDDGCSFSPDSIFHHEVGWACRIHDYRYCSRSMGPRDMSLAMRKQWDKELRDNLNLSFPRWLGWIRFIYYKAVRLFGTANAWDSCGPDAGEYCKHNMPIPLWMEAQDEKRD